MPRASPGDLGESGRYLRALSAWLPQELDGAATIGPLTAAVVPGEAAARVPLQAVVEVFSRDRVLQEAAAEAEVSSGSCGGKGGETWPQFPSTPCSGTQKCLFYPTGLAELGTVKISPLHLPFPLPGRRSIRP